MAQDAAQAIKDAPNPIPAPAIAIPDSVHYSTKPKLAQSVPNATKTKLPVTIIRRITLNDAEAIAKLVAKRITEQGACLMLGIKPQTWFQWKTRHKNSSIFEQLVIRIRETKLNACIEAIDECGDSHEITTNKGTTFTKPGDWRAKAWLAERVLAPDRFQDGQAQAQAALVSPALTMALSKVYACLLEPQKRVEDEKREKAREIVIDCPPLAPDWHQFTG